MKRDVVRDFLNLPGIVGVALVDGRSRPFFFGIDQTLNFQQKEALAQGIQQVVETTPSSFEFFEFQFSGYQVYIYKLEHGIILLVLTNEELVYSSYSLLVSQLKNSLQEDLSNAIANFRLAAGNVTLSGQRYWNRQSDSGATTLSTGFAANSTAPSQTQPPRSGGLSSPSSAASSDTPQNGRSSPSSTPVRSSQPPSTRPSSRPAAESKPAESKPSESKPAEQRAIANSSSPRSAPVPPAASNSAAPDTAQSQANRARAAQERAIRQRQTSDATPPSKSPVNRPSPSSPTAASAPSQASSKPKPPQQSNSTQNFIAPSPKPADQEARAAKTGNNIGTPVPHNKPVALKEILDALNQLSKLTTRYLGTTIVANYWKSSRPPVEWLANFEVDRSGKIEFVGPMTPGKTPVLSSVQHQLLRDWVDAFIQRCSRVIRDFSTIIQKMDLDPHQRNLLLPKDN